MRRTIPTKIPSQWPAIVFLIAVLATIVALAFLEETELVRTLVGMLIGLVMPSPFFGASASSPSIPQAVPLEPEPAAEDTDPTMRRSNDYDQ